ncbi:MAG: PAS domain-containing protein [Deltaproteobacteria bacterium]|nr:PAS domain-containing protein [Deltaproteobacteria bacterium]MBW2613218.1 PAS domain-containing protein [Deltaproteobacteria bacterium]MBW2677462.1 PAS domain-containing protein [Deltaproteobacteria bacterium]
MDIRVAYCLPFFTAAFLILTVGVYTYSRRQTRGAWYLILVCLASSIWAFTEGMLYLGFDIKSNMLITKLQYLGIALAPPLALLFGLSMFKYEAWITRRKTMTLFAVSAIIILLVWTNAYHKLVFTEYFRIDSGQFPMLGLKHGVVWWLIIIYHYALTAILSIVLFRKVVFSSGFHRSQAGVILSAVVVVWVVNGIYVSGNSPVPNMDVGPLAFALVAISMAWGFFRYNLLDILPVAKAEIFDGLSDPIFVVDEKNRLIDINPAAESMFNIDATASIGQKIDDLLINYPELLRSSNAKQPNEISLMTGGRDQFIDVRVSDLKDRKGLKIGRLFVLHDITKRIVGEEAQRESERLQGVFEMAGAICHELNQPLMALSGYVGLLAMKLPKNHPQYEKIAKIQKQVSRLTETTQKLMNITKYETKEYLRTKIIDIDKSSKSNDTAD